MFLLSGHYVLIVRKITFRIKMNIYCDLFQLLIALNLLKDQELEPGSGVEILVTSLRSSTHVDLMVAFSEMMVRCRRSWYQHVNGIRHGHQLNSVNVSVSIISSFTMKHAANKLFFF